MKLLELIRAIGTTNARRALLYPCRRAWVDSGWRRDGRRRRGPARWTAFRRALRTQEPSLRGRRWRRLGKVVSVAATPRGALIATQQGRIEIHFLADDLVRLRYLHDRHPAPPPPPYAVDEGRKWPPVAVTVVETNGAIFVRSRALTVGVMRQRAQLFIAEAQGGQIVRADVEVAWSREGFIRHRVALAPDERLYGLGERATAGNRRGRTHILWNRDPAGYAPGDDPINLNIPVYLGVRPGDGPAYLAFYENPFYARFDLGEGKADVAEHRFAGGELRLYLAVGELPRLLERYTELTGRHPLPPRWFLGYQQSRWSYVPESRVRKLVADFRRHEVPVSAIHLDIDYMDGFRVFTWDERRFDLPKLAADLAEEGIRLVTIIDPGVKREKGYAVYESGRAGEHFCRLPDGREAHGPVWPGDCAFPDFTRAETRRWWGEQYKPLVEAGIAGFWNDMNEPALFAAWGDPTLPLATRHALEGRGGDHREAHNLYGMQMVRASWEGLRRLRPDRRPVVITRAGWAGVQRYATSWTGDNESTWASLRLVVPQLIGLGLSGLGFTGPDVGGFAGEPDGELFTRWVQMAAFLPFFRAHTITGTPAQEPWSYGEPYLTIVRRFIQLRYELLPYLYTAAWQMSRYGWPMVRPLAWLAPDEAALWEDESAFLCGDALLVAPVMEAGATSRPVRLPPGDWYDFWTHHVVRGEVEAVAPLEVMPLYVRAGAILPLGEPRTEPPDKFLRLHLYLPTADGERVSWLYEDAGDGYGLTRLSRFTVRREGERLTVRWAREGEYEPSYEHIELAIHGLRRVPRDLTADGEPFAPAYSDGMQRSTIYGLPPFDRLEVEL